VPYTTPADVRGVLNQTGDPSDLGSAASESDAFLNLAITDAQVEVDARLSGRYPVPFDDPNASMRIPVPPLVKRITRDIAAYLATLTFKKGAPIDVGHPVLLRNNSAQSLLNGIATGAIDLDLPSGWEADQPAEAASGGMTVVDPNPGTFFSPGDFDIGPAFPSGRRGRRSFDDPY
jgi:phage gp36-like protein